MNSADIKRWIQRTPATSAIICIAIVSFFLGASGMGRALAPLVFLYPSPPAMWWTAITWPAVNLVDPFSCLFICLWASMFCGSLERGWGTRAFLIFFLVEAVALAVALSIGCSLLGAQHGLVSFWPALCVCAAAWATVNRHQSVSLWPAGTVPGAAIGWFAAVYLWYIMGGMLLGLFPAVVCLGAYYYVRNGRYAYDGYRQTRRPSPNFRQRADLRMSGPAGENDDVRGPAGWLKNAQEAQRLRRLLERRDDEGKR